MIAATGQVARGGGGAGFTLVELLVVLAIIGMLLSVAPALFSKSRERMNVKAAAQMLATDLRALRGIAIAQDRETQLTIDMAKHQFSGNTDPRIRRLPNGVAVRFTGARRRIEGNLATIGFFPDGSSTGGEVDLSGADETHRVVVHWLTGRVSVDD